MHLTYYGLSDIGLGRTNNEDVWAAVPEIGFFALADGMGGHQAGEVAAAAVVHSLCESIRLVKTTNCMEWIIELRYAIEKANQQIRCMGQRSRALFGMGTTICSLLWTEKAVIYAHVGDSRIYRLRQKKLELLTEDHSFLAKWKSFGHLAQRCITQYPYKNVITRAIGARDRAKPEIALSPPEKGDLYFLCTDGLSDVLSLHEMEEAVNHTPDLHNACKTLIEKAKRKGSSDNITLLMVQSET